MTVVTETLDLANGSTPRGARVYFRLAGTNGTPVEGEVGSVSVVGDLPVPVLANGSYSVDLYGNDVISPSGTRWKRFVVLASGPNPAPVYVNVPSTGGPYAVAALLDEAPASVASSALTTEIANRVAGDATNATAVTAEATARTTADSVLASAITAETSRATTAEAGLQAAGTSVPRHETYAVDFGVVAGGLDNTTGLNAAMAAAAAIGGGLELPAGTIDFQGQLNWTNVRRVLVHSPGAFGDAGDAGSVLRYTATGSTAPILLGSSRGVAFMGVDVMYTSASFTGRLIDAQKVNGGGDTCYLSIFNGKLGSTSQTSAAALLVLDGSHDTTIEGVNFTGCQRAIIGKLTQGISSTGGYAISVNVRSSAFNRCVLPPIHNPDEAWSVNATFESLYNGGAKGAPGAISHASGVLAKGLELDNCWLADADAAIAGAWITFGGSGLVLLGGRIEARDLTTVVKIDENNTSGPLVLGTVIDGTNGSSVGFDWTGTTGCTNAILLPAGWTGITTATVNAPAGTFDNFTGVVRVNNAALTGTTNAAVLTALATSVASLLIAASSANLLSAQNASFESTGTGGWGNNGNTTFARSTVEALHGTACLRVHAVATASDASSSLVVSSVAVSGSIYTAVISAKALTNARTARIEIQWLDSGGSFISSSNGANIALTLTGWTQLSVTAAAPTNASGVRIIVRYITPAAGDEFDLDCAQLVLGTTTVWSLPGGTQQVQILQGVISQLAANTALELQSAGTAPVEVNVSPGGGTGGMTVGDGAGNTIWSFLATAPAFARSLTGMADAAALKTALAIAQSDVSGLVAALAALQPLDSDLTAIAALTTTSYGRAFLALADAAAARTALALGTASLVDTGTGAANVPTVTQADARYQPLAANLTSLASLGGEVAYRHWMTGSRYYYPPNLIGTTTGTCTTGTLDTVAYVIPNDIPVDRIGCEVTTLAASVYRLGVHLADGTDGRAGTRSFDAGTVDVSSTGAKEIVISKTLTKGRLWATGLSEGGAPVIRVMRALSGVVGNTSANPSDPLTASCYRTSSVSTGSMPDPCPAATSVSTGPVIYFRTV